MSGGNAHSGHGVERCSSRVRLCLLNEDRRSGELVVLPAVVEVQVRGDDGADIIDGNAVAAQCVYEVVVHRRVEVIDEGVPDAHARVDQNRPGWVHHKVREHRVGRPRPRQVWRWRDIGQMEWVDLDHEARSEVAAMGAVCPTCPWPVLHSGSCARSVSTLLSS